MQRISLKRPLLIPEPAVRDHHGANGSWRILRTSGLKPLGRRTVEKCHAQVLPVHVGLPGCRVAIREEKYSTPLHKHAHTFAKDDAKSGASMHECAGGRQPSSKTAKTSAAQ